MDYDIRLIDQFIYYIGFSRICKKAVFFHSICTCMCMCIRSGARGTILPLLSAIKKKEYCSKYWIEMGDPSYWYVCFPCSNETEKCNITKYQRACGFQYQTLYHSGFFVAKWRENTVTQRTKLIYDVHLWCLLMSI